MKFLLDMGIAQSTTAFLQKKGNDARHLNEENLHKLEDIAIINKAIAEENNNYRRPGLWAFDSN